VGWKKKADELVLGGKGGLPTGGKLKKECRWSAQGECQGIGGGRHEVELGLMVDIIRGVHGETH